jgi:toxin HigB-1
MAGSKALDKTRYVLHTIHMIRGFSCKRTEEFFLTGKCPAPWRSFEKVVERKLDMLSAATSLNDLRSPPGNRLEKLRGDRAAQWSIRINDQFRICFVWGEDGPEQVAIVDYHD